MKTAGDAGEPSGIDLGETPEQILSKLMMIASKMTSHDGRHAHDYDCPSRARYSTRLARYNADPDRLFESSGCAGKLDVFAVRLDTYRREKSAGVLYRHQQPGS